MESEKVLYDGAMSFLGIPYRWGGDDPMSGFDCSGLCQEILAIVGMDPPLDQTANALYQHFRLHGVEQWGFGALAFFGDVSLRMTHVGFCLNNEIMLEAGGGGSATKTEKDAAKTNAFVRLRPIETRRDLRIVLMPKYPWVFQK